jgi:hypothetical protein
MGKVMSKEQDARDLALREYDKFMEKYKQGVEAGNMKLMQHMLKLEADKIRTQSILDSIEKSSAGLDENVYDFEETKMKIQMDSNEYREDQAREQAFIKMATKDTTKEQAPKPAPISIGDPDKIDTYRLDAMDFGQIAKPAPKKEVKKEVKKKVKPVVSVDPDTGKKVYNGPKLKSRRVVDGKEWDSSHPNYNG